MNRKHCVICGKFIKDEFFCKKCKSHREKKVSLLKYLNRIFETYGNNNPSCRIIKSDLEG